MRRRALLTVCVALAVRSALGLPKLKRRRRSGAKLGAARSGEAEVVKEDVGSGRGAAVRGAVGLLGGTMAHLVLGSFYCVPNIASYMPAEVQYFKGGGSGKPDALYSMPLTLLTSSVIMPLGAWLATEVSAPLAALVGGLIVASSFLLASRATRCWQFVLAQGAVFGVGHGVGYTAPMIAGWRVFPKRRGLVSGTIMTGFGTAAFAWNPLITLMVNPDNLAPPFPASVAARVGPTLRSLAALFCGVSVLGAALVSISPDSSTGPAAKRDRSSTTGGPSRALASPTFWRAWALCLLSASAALNVAALWKGFAIAAGSEALRGDDRALALAGSASALGNGLGRFLFATVSDLFGLGPTYLGLLTLQLAAMLALGPTALLSPAAYALDLFLVFFCLGGIFSLSPPLASALFGPVQGPKIYGMIFSAFPFASVAGQLLAQALLPKLGWHNLIRILAALGATAFLPLAGLFPLLHRPN